MPRRSHRIRRTAAALAVLAGSLTACSAETFERCVPEESTTAGAVQLPGTYEGALKAKGVRLTLTTASGGKGAGTLTAENWPTGSAHEATLGKTFSGSGTWEVETDNSPDRRRVVRLHFDKPELFLPGDTVDKLSIGIDAERTFVYTNPDPEICPKFRLKLQPTT
ncbi:hypothetical protein OG264_16615 [Streptomyces xanthophaeus]|uniref:hypothetical protein n=1 Tax=Streptomyces xanthophaeus TaxID=67385 RepID=UPI003868C602|nr:hypothetical protein OG264_16615 [Streptomyces xanthophaeus]WST62051.1 hypothetical protein OG605_21820 [Streptomyces xanthophaeus]